jgi:hypothetical protein
MTTEILMNYLFTSMNKVLKDKITILENQIKTLNMKNESSNKKVICFDF